MGHTAHMIVAGVLGVLMITGQAEALDPGPAQRDPQHNRATSVKISPDSGGADGRVEAVIDIAAPRARVWSVMLDCARAPSFMPALKSCTVLSSDPNGASDVREHRTSWSELFPDMRSVFRSDYIKETSIRFTRVDGDLKFLEGDWRLEPLENGKRTRLHYRARIGIAWPVPSFLIRNALERDVPLFLETLRTEIERPAKSTLRAPD